VKTYALRREPTLITRTKAAMTDDLQMLWKYCPTKCQLAYRHLHRGKVGQSGVSCVNWWRSGSQFQSSRRIA